jgi:hypothetical protein
MTILLTDDQLTKLHAETARLTEEAERLLEAAEATDDPDDWDAWKEADGIAAGHAGHRCHRGRPRPGTGFDELHAVV